MATGYINLLATAVEIFHFCGINLNPNQIREITEPPGDEKLAKEPSMPLHLDLHSGIHIFAGW